MHLQEDASHGLGRLDLRGVHDAGELDAIGRRHQLAIARDHVRARAVPGPNMREKGAAAVRQAVDQRTER